MERSSNDARAASALGAAALVVLAAGRSLRMGSPKALIEWEGRPLVAHLLAPPLLRELADAVVVLGHHAEAVRTAVERCGGRCVINPDPDRGRTGSLQIGLRALGAGVRAAFVQPVDCPLVRRDTYVCLASALGTSDAAIPAHRGRRGHPPLLSARLFPRILAAAPDEPLRNLLSSPELDCRLVEVDDPGVLLNIDRPEDLESLRRIELR